MIFKRMTERVKRFFAEIENRELYVLLLTMALLLALAVIVSGCIVSNSPMTVAFALISGVAGGKHVVDGPLTTDVTREGSPTLLLNEIDREIVKIRPMATPLDQISRHASVKHAGSMIADYYMVDTKPTMAKLAQDYEEPSTAQGDAPRAALVTDNNLIFDVSDTILVQGVKGYESDGVTESESDLVLYVVDRDDNNNVLHVSAVNGKKIGTASNCVPSLYSNTKLIRMGRAASELDVMSPLFESLPVKSTNFCQIFKLQVEQSTLQKLSNKETPWNLSDQEEAAIYDMRLGMEKSFLFGVKSRIWDPNKKEHVLTTGGIWRQAGKEMSYDDTLNADALVDIMREAFTGNAGSKRKILIGGSGLISSLNKLDYTRVVGAAQSVTKWGIDFTEVRSKFGTLLVMLSEVFDECGMADDGIIIDPEYITKYCHIPFSTQRLDLKASGQRNVDAIVLTEASCLVLRYPKAHMRIVKR